MSLIKQLWIATLCLTLLALGGSLVVGTLSARDYLVQAGVPAEKITAVGRGSVEPVVDCGAGERGQAQIDCLAPNRRVEVKVVLP